MPLTKRIAELSQLLATTAGIEEEPALEGVREALVRAIDQFLEEHAALLGRQKVLALDLIAAIRNGRKDSPDWLSSNSPGQQRYLKGNRTELEEFAREAVAHGIAGRLIDELTGERDRYVKLLQTLVNLSNEELASALNGIEDGEMIKFCESNEIRISRSAKIPFNRSKTIANIRRRITELQEFLKLSQLGS
jgi:hypothetical protein